MRIRFPLQRELPFEFVYELFSLLAAIVLVHAVYVTLVRPLAAADLEQQAIRLEQEENYVPERSVYVVIRDLEQEACFVLMLWALAIMAYKGKNVIRERMLLHEDLIPIEEGTKILYSDARSFERHIRSLPENVVRSFLPRCLLAALHRFRSGWMAERTARINGVRGVLREQGIVIPVGAPLPISSTLGTDPGSFWCQCRLPRCRSTDSPGLHCGTFLFGL